MSNRTTRRRRIAAVVILALIFIVALRYFGRHDQGPANLNFVLVSKGQPTEFYHRDFNKMVPAGWVFWKLEAAMKKFGWKGKLVSRTSIFGNTNRIYVLIGIDGDIPQSSEVGGMIITSSDRIPLKMSWQRLSGTTNYRIFWKSGPLPAVPNRGLFLVTNSNSGRTLISHKF